MRAPRPGRLATVAGVALTLTAAATVAFGSGSADPQRSTGTAGAVPGDSIAALQARLARVPGDYPAWASLGLAYVDQARVTGDPAFYAKADGALARSLKVHSEDNFQAHIGLGAVAAARHDFSTAEKEARLALAVNDHNATAYGVLTDALTELGRYDESLQAVQRMLDLRPGTSSLSRASYQLELRGDTAGARSALTRAREDAANPADMAFTDYYLGELAWNSGDLTSAGRHYDAGLAADSSYLPNLQGQAKVAAARGNMSRALELYANLTSQLPQPSYLIEYADLLTAAGKTVEARAQVDLVRTEQRLFEAAGVNVDLELALFDADHGQPRQALEAAQAERRARDSVAVDDALAWALHVNGRDREALAASRRAARLGTRSALFAFHRGMIEAALGMRTEATAHLREALRINPHFSPVQAPVAKRTLAGLTR